MEYITPEESIILNVISAQVDFSTSESIRMSQMVDKTGERTFAVVTKADRSPEGLFEKVTADDVRIGLGYVCVRNRIGDESFEEARSAESQLFNTDPMLSKIDKSIVGIPNLARRLVRIQASIIAKCLPNIFRQINDKLNSNVTELNSMPRSVNSVADAMAAFMRILGSAKDSLRKILVTGEYDEFPDESKMHCTARLAEMLNGYSDQIEKATSCQNLEGNMFLMEEVKVLEESKGIWLPNFLLRSVFLTFLCRKVKGINPTPAEFIVEVWEYLEGVIVKVMMKHFANYPQLHSMVRRSVESAVSSVKKQGMDRMTEMLEMEMITDYTCNPEYMSTWNKLMTYQQKYMAIVENVTHCTSLWIDGFGEVDVAHMRAHKSVAQQAFDMKMRVAAYWKIVLRRVVDSIALYLLFSVRNLVNKELEGFVEELTRPGGGGIEKMLDEAPSIANKRDRLTRSIELLKESKQVLGQIMDFID